MQVADQVFSIFVNFLLDRLSSKDRFGSPCLPVSTTVRPVLKFAVFCSLRVIVFAVACRRCYMQQLRSVEDAVKEGWSTRYSLS